MTPFFFLLLQNKAHSASGVGEQPALGLPGNHWETSHAFWKVIPFVACLPPLACFLPARAGSGGQSPANAVPASSPGNDSKVSLGENCWELQEIKKFLQYQPTSQSQSVVSQPLLHSEVRPARFLKSNFQPREGSLGGLKPYLLLCFVNLELITLPLSLLPRVWLSPRPHQSEP